MVTIDNATSCAGGTQPGTRCLEGALLAAFPRSRSGGTYNCRAVRGGTHLSVHAAGRAVDVMTSDRPYGDAIAAWAVRNSPRWQIQRVIWNRRIWQPDTGWQGYHGQNPHTDHVHVEQNIQGGERCPGVAPLLSGMTWIQSAIVACAAIGTILTIYHTQRTHHEHP